MAKRPVHVLVDGDVFLVEHTVALREQETDELHMAEEWERRKGRGDWRSGMKTSSVRTLTSGRVREGCLLSLTRLVDLIKSRTRVAA